MRNPFFVCALALLLAACGTSQPIGVVDPPFRAEDEAALRELAEQPPPARRVSAASVAPAAGPLAVAKAAPSPLLEVHVFDIGQGDSMLVVGPAPDRKTLLIDLGEPTERSELPEGFDSVMASAEHVLERIHAITGKSHVDYFVLTHFHSDHGGRGFRREQGWGTGIIKLLSDFSIDFSVGEFIHVGDDGAQFMRPAAQRSTTFQTVLQRMPIWLDRGRVGTESAPRFGTAQIELGDGVEVDILGFAGRAPQGPSAFERAIAAGATYADNPGDENDLSIALQITAGEFELWTGGDLNGSNDFAGTLPFVERTFSNGTATFTNVENHLVRFWRDNGRETDVEVYRANHHGSGFSSVRPLLAALDPELILYSTGADHRHPDKDVVQRGGGTADQLATTAVANRAAFTNASGSVVGEITLLVARDGRSYTVNGRQRTAFTDAEERAGDDEN